MATVGMTCEGIIDDAVNDNEDTVENTSDCIPTENQDAGMDSIGGETGEDIASEKPVDEMEIEDMVTFFEKRKKEFPDLEDIEEIRVMIGEILKQEDIASEKPVDGMEIEDMVTFFEKREKEFPDLEDIEEIRVMIGEILKQEKDHETAESNKHDNEEVSCIFIPCISNLENMPLKFRFMWTL